MLNFIIFIYFPFNFLGATRTSEAKETIFARQWVVTVAKSFGLQAIDVVYIDYKGIT